MPYSTDFTTLLVRARVGDAESAERAFALLYGELRRLAAAQLRRERAGHTLQPTALVNEAFLRLPSGLASINDRHHFFALAARAMRRVLVDHARRRGSSKRGANPVRVTFANLAGPDALDVDVVALDEALTRFEVVDERAAKVVTLRFFGGHTDAEVAEMLGIAVATVRRDWEYARAWLRSRLGQAGEGPRA